MSAFKKVTHLLFNQDGVLLDTEFWYFMAMQDELRGRDVAFSLEDYFATGGSAYKNLLQDTDHNEFCESRDRRYQIYLGTQDVQVPGAENILAMLHDHFPLAMVTSSGKEQFDHIHEHRNLKDYFSLIVLRDDYQRPKPEPDPYLAAIKQLGIKPEQALVIEDSAAGLQSALAADIPCVIVKNTMLTEQDFSGAAAYIETITALPKLLGLDMPGIHRD